MQDLTRFGFVSLGFPDVIVGAGVILGLVAGWTTGARHSGHACRMTSPWGHGRAR